VPAFCLDDVVAIAAAEESGDSEARARANDADNAAVRQWPLGTANVLEVLVRQRRHRISDGAEIVDDRVALNA
jgi:hypothetical protein